MLKEVKKILYASDLGENSRPAFRYAVQEAIKHEAEIVFFHAIRPMSELTEDVIENYFPENISKKHIKKVINSKSECIKTRIDEFLFSEMDSTASLVKPVTISVVVGKPSKSILHAAKHSGADMIVMGDRETSAMARIFLGSTAQNVIHQSVIPVMIVPLACE